MAAQSQPHGERLAQVEQWQTDHETRCEERMSEIRGSISGLREDIAGARKFANRTLVGILLALLAFGAKEVWTARGGIAASAAIMAVERQK